MSVNVVGATQVLPSPSSHPTRLETVATHAIVGGAIGATAGAGLSFTALPFIGALSAPLAAAVGGVAGLVIGSIVGLLRSRESSNQAHAGVRQVLPPPLPHVGRGSAPQLPPPLPSA